jgi:hypothetical protein
MSPPPSLEADSRLAPSTGGDTTVNTDRTPQPSLNPSRGDRTADGEANTAKPSETYVNDYEFF